MPKRLQDEKESEKAKDGESEEESFSKLVMLGAPKEPELRTITIIGTLGILLNAIYFLRAYQRVFTGPLNEKYSTLKDITPRELYTVVPIAFFVFLFGVYPAPLVDVVAPAMENIINIIKSAV